MANTNRELYYHKGILVPIYNLVILQAPVKQQLEASVKSRKALN